MKKKNQLLTVEQIKNTIEELEAFIEKEPIDLHLSRLIRVIDRHIIRSKMKPCQHAKVTDEKFNENRPCMGAKVICKNPRAPEGHIYYSSGCNKWKCKLYES